MAAMLLLIGLIFLYLFMGLRTREYRLPMRAALFVATALLPAMFFLFW